MSMKFTADALLHNIDIRIVDIQQFNLCYRVNRVLIKLGNL